MSDEMNPFAHRSDYTPSVNKAFIYIKQPDASDKTLLRIAARNLSLTSLINSMLIPMWDC